MVRTTRKKVPARIQPRRPGPKSSGSPAVSKFPAMRWSRLSSWLTLCKKGSLGQRKQLYFHPQEPTFVTVDGTFQSEKGIGISYINHKSCMQEFTLAAAFAPALGCFQRRS